MQSKSADFVIVGGGLAGCVVASRLKDLKPDCSILLLEAGTDEHQNPLIQSPLAAFGLHNTEVEYNYRTVPQKGLDKRQIYTCGGKVLSGGSAVNYALWTRGDAADYNAWADAVKDDRWSYSGQLKYFKRLETHHDKASNPEAHGFSGPIHTVAALDRDYPLRERVRRAFVDTGAAEVPDANNGFPHGLAPYCENWKDGKRQPAGEAYSLAGVQVITKQTINRVILEEREGALTAVGVEATSGEAFYANKEVILSCGALRTPQVLMLSGIGPKSQLKAHDIEPLVECPQVGQNLHDHVVFCQYWKVQRPDDGICAGSPNFNKPAFTEGVPCDYLLTESVPSHLLKKALISDGESIVNDSHPHLRNRGHYEALFCYAPAASSMSDMSHVPFDGSHFCSAVMMLLPISRGTIEIGSKDALDAPIIDPGYLAAETDRICIRQGVRRILAAVETPHLQEIIECETLPEEGGFPALTTASSDADIDARIRRGACTFWHPAGTAAMGTVVDTDLRLKGVKSLRIVDASVLPLPIAAHYQVAIYALAEQAAEIIGASA